MDLNRNNRPERGKVMDLRQITESDWKDFDEKYPDASMYLLRCSLINEFSELSSIRPIMRTEWQQNRYNELYRIYGIN